MAVQRILVLGTGPTTMGQGPEYSRATAVACRTLRELGHTVVLMESHASSPACDPQHAHTTYIEPISRESVEKVLLRERPHSVLATVSGQHAFNTMLLMQHSSFAQAQRPTFFGSSYELLDATQNTEHFTRLVQSLGLQAAHSFVVSKKKHGEDLGRQLGFPVVVRAALAAGGIGTSITFNTHELDHAIDVALAVSPVGQVVIGKSLQGCKRTEWLVLRDARDHVTVAGSIEYIEPLGINSADSPAVVPVQSLAKEDVQFIEGIVARIVRRFQLTGAAMVQLAHGKDNRAVTVVSVSPHITSSALLCGRAAMVPLADWHTRLCDGANLDELQRATRVLSDDLFETSLPQEPWCWCRLPVFPDWRLMGSHEPLTTYTKSIGNVTCADTDFIAALQKAVYAAGLPALGPGYTVPKHAATWDELDLRAELSSPTAQRLWDVYRALQAGISTADLHQLTHIDPWFIERLQQLCIHAADWSDAMQKRGDNLAAAKQAGCSDEQLARVHGIEEHRVREQRMKAGVLPGVRTMQMSAPGSAHASSFHVLAYGAGSLRRLNDQQARVVVIGSECSLMQGRAEHEFITAHAVAALHAAGREAILIAPSPLHTADELDVPVRHYVEAVRPETLRDIIELERPQGVILQCAVRQPRDILQAIEQSNVPLLGTPLESIMRLMHRDRFQTLLQKLDIRQPSHGMAENAHQAYRLANDVGYPAIVHPAQPIALPRVAIWYDQHDARVFLEQASQLSELYPLSVETFLEAAREFHIEAIADGEEIMVLGVVEHVEEAGIHSADSASVWPSNSIPSPVLIEGREVCAKLVRELKLRGLFSAKCAVANDKLYLLDVLPHATRNTALLHTVTGGRVVPLAVQTMLGATLKSLNCHELTANYLAVRVPVFPFSHFPGSDASLGPENCSIGQAIGIDRSFGIAYAKALAAAGNKLPTKGHVLISVADRDKDDILPVVRRLRALGFGILATSGTSHLFHACGIPVDAVLKIQEGRPNVIDHIIDGNVQLIINTPGGKSNKIAEAQMRHEAVERGILVITTTAGAHAAVAGIEAFMRHGFDVRTFDTYLKELHQQQELRLDILPAMELNV